MALGFLWNDLQLGLAESRKISEMAAARLQLESHSDASRA